MIRTANAGSMITPSAQQVLDAYAAHTGFNPNDPGTDNGDDETSAIHYLQQVGFLGHKCDLTTGILVSNLDHIRWCVQLFGACRLGINLPQSAMDQFNSNQPWKDVGDNTIIGGHDVPICHYEGDTFYIITWAKRQPVDISFLKSENYLEEAHAELYFDWANAQGACPSGLDFQALAQDIRAVQ